MKPFSWLELERYAKALNSHLLGAKLDQVYNASSPDLVLALSFKTQDRLMVLLLGLKAPNPFVILRPKRAEAGFTFNIQKSDHPLTPFALKLRSSCVGARVSLVSSLFQERILEFQFSLLGQTLRLYLELFPLRPRGILKGPEWMMSSDPHLKAYEPPNGKNAPEGLSIREEWVDHPLDYAKAWISFLQEVNFKERLRKAQAHFEAGLQSLKKAYEQAKVQYNILKSKKEPFQLQALALKANLHLLKTSKDFEVSIDLDGQVHKFKIDSFGLAPAQRMVELFELEKAQSTNLKKARIQLEIAQSKLEKKIQEKPGEILFPDWKGLALWEQFSSPKVDGSKRTKGVSSKKLRLFSGRTYFTSRGDPIWGGRNKVENQKLVFKHAHGNDLWFHIRGRASAHVVLACASPSLEDLLDASHVLLSLSKAKGDGPQEVVYTPCKYVKPIRQSNQVRYSQEGSLFVSWDQERWVNLEARGAARKSS